MVATAEELLQGALQLDASERASLARAILASLDEPDDIAAAEAAWTAEIRRRARAVDDATETPSASTEPDVAAAWTAEIRRRAKAIEDGTEPLVDGPASLRAIRERLGLR